MKHFMMQFKGYVESHALSDVTVSILTRKFILEYKNRIDGWSRTLNHHFDS